MAYRQHKRVPPHTHFVPGHPDAHLLSDDKLTTKWSGRSRFVPRIGTEVRVRINSMERATVRGYFTEDSWLGLIVVLHDPPHWWKRQNGRTRTAHVFGIEIDIPCRYCDGIESYQVNAAGKCDACNGTKVHPLDDDPDADLTAEEAV